MKEVTTVNLRHAGFECEYLSKDRMECHTSVLSNIRHKARSLGFDLWSWNDAEILSLLPVVDEDDFAEILGEL